jgi:hypothetical protein
MGMGIRGAGDHQSYKMLDVLLPGADLDLIKAEDRAFEQFWGRVW